MPPPPQKLFINGVKKVNCSETSTLIRLPAPVPPNAAEHAKAVPVLSVHADVTVRACSPFWDCTLASRWATVVRLPLVVVGLNAAYEAASRAVLLSSM